MKAPALEPTSAAKAGWLIVLLTVGWMVFIMVPWPKDKPPPPIAPVPVPATSLTRAGLPESTDWEGLPEIFAIWADKAEWKDNRTRFAYWHPVMKSYSYYFEAIRVKDGYRFREIVEPRDPGYEWDESLGEDCPIRFYRAVSGGKLKAPDLPLSSAIQTPAYLKPENVPVKIPMAGSKITPPSPMPKP